MYHRASIAHEGVRAAGPGAAVPVAPRHAGAACDSVRPLRQTIRDRHLQFHISKHFVLQSIREERTLMQYPRPRRRLSWSARCGLAIASTRNGLRQAFDVAEIVVDLR